MLLQNVPEAVKSLLDNCIVANDVGSDNIGKVVFDFFLFQPETGDDELALVDLVIATGKKGSHQKKTGKKVHNSCELWGGRVSKFWCVNLKKVLFLELIFQKTC